MNQGTQDYSGGKRVYRGASSAPNRGRVDPLGYKERSSNNALKNAAKRRLAAMRKGHGR